MKDGLIVVDKPVGYTSRDIVNIVGRFLNTKKVGHAGTLDPIATGVLVIGVGEGLKLIEFLSTEEKEYVARARFGVSTDTLDMTGNIIESTENYFVNESKLMDVLKSFKGKYFQEVPLYSSVKVNGKKLYSYARQNIDVTLPVREVEIFDIELLSIDHYGFTFKVRVSKGTYIRSLIRDIGKKIGILCTMSSLRRTVQGDFNLEDAIQLDDIENNDIKYVSWERALKRFPKVTADSYLEKRILNGCILENRYDTPVILFENSKGEALAMYKVYEKDNSKVKPMKVFKKV